MSQDYPHVSAEVHLSVYDYDEELARLQGNSDVVKLVDDVDTRALVLDPGCASSGQVAPPFSRYSGTTIDYDGGWLNQVVGIRSTTHRKMTESISRLLMEFM
ncbi:MAG: hypothetical protein QXM92_04055 [Candidatus Anstonellales archaeon]